ncbi:MAG: FAD-dependent oxidoreductase, partial [Candidatus Latescibacteria bacterium]|nr:FAD-dependent oxidoreductase [Candidatus Latescibacterota bacterium]
MKIAIVGGVAGGASCAARARRLSEEAEIVVFDRGPYASFANCGLPYYVGDVIQAEEDLLVATPGLFRDRLNIDVRCENEVLAIDRDERWLSVKDRKTGVEYSEKYDRLVLATGAAPIRPPLPGINLPGIFSLRTIPDSRRIKEWIAEHRAERVLIIGGGFIGLEMAENLAGLGLSVRIVERLNQVMPALDPEMIVPVHDHLRESGVGLCLGEAVKGFAVAGSGQLTVQTDSAEYPADLVIMAIGVRPETDLSRAAGLEL